MLNKNNGKQKIINRDILKVIPTFNKSKMQKIKKSQTIFKTNVEYSIKPNNLLLKE